MSPVSALPLDGSAFLDELATGMHPGGRLSVAEPLSSLGADALAQTARELTRARNLAAVSRLDVAYALVDAAQRDLDSRARDDRLRGRAAPPKHAALAAERIARATVTTAMCVTDWHAERLVTAAVQLHTRLRRLDAAARTGSLDESTIVALACRLKDVADEMLPAVESQVVESVMQQAEGGDQPSRRSLDEQVDRAVESVDPEDLERRAEKARADRRLSFRPAGNGMTSLWATMPSEDAAELRARIEAIADSQDAVGRTRMQHLVDVLARLGLACVPSEPAGAGSADDFDGVAEPDGPAPSPAPITKLSITVIASIAAGLPARVELVRGAYSAYEWLARKTLSEGNNGVRFDLIDPLPGAEDHPESSLKYHISAAMRRRIRLRDGTCRHPGCHVAAEECEVDHVIAFDHHRPELGGPTAEWNLVCLCKKHHQEKTFGRWSYKPGALGELIIITETGHRYTTLPRGMLARARDDLLDHADDPEYYATSFRDKRAAARYEAAQRADDEARREREQDDEAAPGEPPVDIPGIDMSEFDPPPPAGPLHLIDDDLTLTNPPGAERNGTA